MSPKTCQSEKAAVLTTPHTPIWDSLADAGRKTTDMANDIYGACSAQKNGASENMALRTPPA